MLSQHYPIKINLMIFLCGGDDDNDNDSSDVSGGADKDVSDDENWGCSGSNVDGDISDGVKTLTTRELSIVVTTKMIIVKCMENVFL